jgi:HTH-type transcriptional regulator/antitoxin HigA
MQTDRYRWRPAEVFPPGEFLRDEMAARGWTVEGLAAQLKWPPRVLADVLVGKLRLSTDMAEHLAAVIGTSPEFWERLDTAWQRWRPAAEGGSR